MRTIKSLFFTLSVASVATAQSPTTSTACTSTISPRHGEPSVAAGWTAHVVVSGLTDPRGIIFDEEGGLLVVQQGKGIARMRLNDREGACVQVDGAVEDVIEDEAFNHGIELSPDGRTLYASTPTAVYAWDYDASQGRNTSGPREIVGQMGDTDGHVTRTLLLSRQVEGLLLVSRGSMSNLDPAALDESTGVSTIKAFNLTNSTDSAYAFTESGVLLGWGLRNSVGVAEHPTTGGIFSVENSVDNFQRSGENIHQNNPGEELNFHGFLNGTDSPEQGRNYGYPSCYAAWGVDEIPDNEGIEVGTQFAIGDQNATLNDTFCREQRQAPRLTFQAHTAPLDIKFNTNGSAAWVTFHGSWNRDDPIGYSLAVIPFSSDAGQPIPESDSTTAAINILSNTDLSRCPGECIRPVGLAWDSQGRLFMSSDSTGEIWVIVRSKGGSADEANPSSGLPSQTPSPTSTGGGSGASQSPGAAAGIVAQGGFAALCAGIVGFGLL